MDEVQLLDDATFRVSVRCHANDGTLSKRPAEATGTSTHARPILPAIDPIAVEVPERPRSAAV